MCNGLCVHLRVIGTYLSCKLMNRRFSSLLHGSFRRFFGMQ